MYVRLDDTLPLPLLSPPAAQCVIANWLRVTLRVPSNLWLLFDISLGVSLFGVSYIVSIMIYLYVFIIVSIT